VKVFLDTSAFYALSSSSDQDHLRAKESLRKLIERNAEFVSTNYILLECVSLLQRREGLDIAKRFVEKVIETVTILWIDEAQHKRAWDYWNKAWKRDLSLVDCASFVAMKEEGIKEAFAFDKQFEEAGFIFGG
jgi:predicted nucleic acid-binding protein